MKKILVVSNTAFSISKFRLHYLQKLSKDYKIFVLTPDKLSIPKNINISKNNFGFNNLFNDLYKLHQIIKNKNEYDCILAYSFKYQFYLFLLNFFLNCKIINIIAGRGSLFLIKNKFLLFIRDFFFNLFFKYSDYFIFINPEDALFFKKKFKIKKKIFTIPTEGTEIIKFKQSKLKKKNFLFFSRIIAEKGIHEFIELAKIIKQKFPCTNFFIAGSFSKQIVGQSMFFSKTSIYRKIKRSNFVKLVGFKKKNIPNFLSKMDCLISPSYTEGAGQSVIESIMSGLNVIVYKNSGHNYVLNKNKKFICKTNSLKELTRLTFSFLNQNKNTTKKIIKKSQEYIKNNFASSIVYKKIKNIILNIFDEKKMVSICLASFNQEKYIDECLNSIINQSYSNIEILISDDCSTDKTFNKIENFFSKNKNKYNIKIFKQNKNIGVSNNYNFLFDHSKGEYIVFFGADDIMNQNRISKQVQALNLNPNSSFCYSNCSWFFEKFKLIRFNHFNLLHRPPRVLSQILEDFTIPSPTIMINRKYITQSPFDKGLKYYSDFLQVVKLWKKNNPVYINQNLVLYRRHSKSLINKQTSNWERLIQIEKIKKLYKNNTLFQKKIDKNKYIYMYHEFLSRQGSQSKIKTNILFFLFHNLKSVRGILRILLLSVNIIKLKLK